MQNRKTTDTIAAVATAMSSSGIGIIRVSGSEAIAIVDRIYRSKKAGKCLKDVPSHTVHYGWIQDGDQVLDEVLVIVMKGPHSYTAEDTVEIDCHGGVMMMKKILETVIRYGARPAEPGEFTKRAFLNGRIDLSQAEAVMDVINAQNDYAIKSSVSQLRGSVSRKIKKLREDILYQIAYIESALDDPEHISLDGYSEELLTKLKPMIYDVEKMVKSADNGKIVSEGIKTVILGKPNAGKSSLMNVLLGEERAIVTDIAGTTRDTLEEQIRLHGISLNIIDTAGIRETEDVVEKIGVNRARSVADDADLIIFVVDGSRPMDENDEMIIEMIRDRKAIVLMNKSDLELVVSKEELEQKTGLPVITISAKEETGIDELEKAVQDMFYGGELDFNDEVMITNVRHKTALSDALESLKMVRQSIENQMPEDFLTIDLMDAYEQLGTIVGESVEEDLVNEIFSKFCTGK
jgi:tRNA modification GTPase